MCITSCILCGVLTLHFHNNYNFNNPENVLTMTLRFGAVTCSFKNMYILGLVFGVIGGFITPAFSFILS